MSYMEYISRFINFVCNLGPEWHDLTKLSREHTLKYIEQIYYHANTRLIRKDSHPEHYVRTILVITRNLLENLQTYKYTIAPIKGARTLIFSEDMPKLRKKSYNHVDYIPDYVLEQLFQKINYLQPEVQAFIWIAFKTGLRISDTLTLTQDCLVKLNGKYQVVTDIKKTYVQGHSIPIDDELALNVLVALIAKSKKIVMRRITPTIICLYVIVGLEEDVRTANNGFGGNLTLSQKNRVFETKMATYFFLDRTNFVIPMPSN